MAMLAEPRRKKRTLNLRGKNHWSEDQNKFGKKLMEKMGWTEGKGLGINEHGKTDHLKVRFKDDNGGVGFTDRNDQWTEHETHFESLLKNLHGGDVEIKKLHSECSLEEKSKTLQSRLHYKKFTRGKDVTKYSHKDLANIFGKKSLDKKFKKDVGVVEEKTIEEEVTSNTNLVEGGCMKEYFKSKMSLVSSGLGDSKPKILYEEEDSMVAFRGFSSNCDDADDNLNSDKNSLVESTKKSSFYQRFEKSSDDIEDKPIDKFSFYQRFEKSLDDDKPNEEGNEKKSKKKRKYDECNEEQNMDLQNSEVELKSKSKKSKKLKLAVVEEPSQIANDVLRDSVPEPKQKSKKPRLDGDIQIEFERKDHKQNNIGNASDIKIKSKKSRVSESDPNKATDQISNDTCTENAVDIKEKSKKKKLKVIEAVIEAESPSIEAIVSKKKKSKKNKSENTLEMCVNNSDEIVADKKEKSKKKQKVDNEGNEIKEKLEILRDMHSNNDNDTSLNQKVKATKSKRKKQTYKPLLLLEDAKKLKYSYSQAVQQCIPEPVVNPHDTVVSTKRHKKPSVRTSQTENSRKSNSTYSQVVKKSVPEVNDDVLDTIALAREAVKKSVDLSNTKDLQSKCKLVKEQLKNTIDSISDVQMVDVTSDSKSKVFEVPGPSQSVIPDAMSITSFPNVLSSQSASNSWELLSLKKMLDDPFVSATRKQYLNQRILELNDVIIKELLLSTQRSSKSEEILLLENICSLFDNQNLSAEQKVRLECVLTALREKVIGEIIKEVSNVSIDYEKTITNLQALLNLKCLSQTEREGLMTKVCELREKAAKGLLKQTHAPVDDNVQLLEKVQAVMSDPFLPQECKSKILQKVRYFKNKTINKLTGRQITDSDNDSSLIINLQTLLQDPNISYTKRVQIVEKIKELESSAAEVLRSYKHELKDKLTTQMNEVLNFVGTNLETISGYGVNVETERFVEFFLPDTDTL